MFNLFFLIFLLSVSYISSFGQACDATVSGLANWSSLTWNCTGGGTAPITDGVTYTETVTINSLSDGDILTADVSITIDGDLNINANGADPAFTVPTGVTLIVTGNLNSDNNNVLYTINGTLQVDGTFTVKNGNQFAGNGTLKGGTLVVKNNNTCAGTCPSITFSTCCENGGSDCFPPGSPSTFCTNNNTSGLPVELLYFRASANQSKVLLNWATIQEINNKHFIIQRSRDVQIWQAVDTVDGHGNSEDLLHYETIDEPLEEGLFYYRLKQVDFDGTSAYSPIEGVYVSSNRIRLLVFPNPVTDQEFQVRLNGVSGRINFQLTDILGKRLWQDAQELKTEGYLHKKIGIQYLSKGVYILKVSTNTQTWQQRIVVK
ncbi:hypothetical protein BKI52_31335 [marine bacterium AO1-C]|nr:hypothetical protein BKI52_31335 [marine bacterium AO1-C]